MGIGPFRVLYGGRFKKWGLCFHKHVVFNYYVAKLGPFRWAVTKP